MSLSSYQTTTTRDFVEIVGSSSQTTGPEAVECCINAFGELATAESSKLFNEDAAALQELICNETNASYVSSFGRLLRKSTGIGLLRTHGPTHPDTQERDSSDTPVFIINFEDHQWHFTTEKLAASSKYFDIMISGSFKESHDGVVTLKEDPPAATQCMLQYLTGDWSSEPPTYNVPGDLGRPDSMTVALLHTQVFALGEKYMIPSLCGLAFFRLSRFTKATEGLSSIQGPMSLFSRWEKEQQMCLIHAVYCGSKTIDYRLRDELVRAVVGITLRNTCHALSTRIGYPSIQHHLVSAIALFERPSVKQIACLLSSCGTDQEIYAILSGKDDAPGDYFLSLLSLLSQREVLEEAARKCISQSMEYTSWVAIDYFRDWLEVSVLEKRMLQAWMDAFHIEQEIRSERDQQSVCQHYISTERRELSEYSAKATKLTADVARLKWPKTRVDFLEQNLLNALPECEAMIHHSAGIDKASQTTAEVSSEISVKIKDTEDTLRGIEQSKTMMISSIESWENLWRDHEEMQQKLETRKEIYCIKNKDYKQDLEEL